MLESKFQRKVINEINLRMPNAVILKTDPNYIQGFPDLLILLGHRWASLETKRNKKSSKRPNQEWWVEYLNRCSFSRFINQENMEEVLDELEQAL